MKIITKYFYENGVEMKQHDIVYLEGEDIENNLWFEGLCRVAFVSEEILTVYPLGHSIYSNYAINMHIGEIIRLVRLEGIEEIDKLLNQQIKRALEKDRE